MFKVGELEDDRHRPVVHYFRTLTLILMASRLVLALQYFQTMWHFRRQQTSRRSLMLLAGCYIMAAAIYLGLFFAFTNDAESSAWIVWYVVGIMESLLATFVACTSKHLNSWILDLLPWLTPIITPLAIGKTHELSFKHTHLVQRMSLLTLIILGEGAISVAKQCQVIAEASTFTWNVVNIVIIACAVLILYFMYMIYFDWQRLEADADETIESRSIRQRVWAFIHFFLHLFMVLSVQGLKLGITWSAAMQEVKTLNSINQQWVAPGARIYDSVLSEDDWHDVSDTWSQVLGDITTDQGYISSSMADGLDTVNDIWQYQHALEYFDDLSNVTNSNRAYELCNYTAYTSIFTIAGFGKNSLDTELEEYSIQDFDISSSNWTVGGDDAERLHNMVEIVGKFHLTYIYFCVSIGMVVLLCTALGYLSRPTREGYHRVRLNYSGFAGLALCLLATNALRNGDLFARSVAEPWLLPTTMALLFSGKSNLSRPICEPEADELQSSSLTMSSLRGTQTAQRSREPPTLVHLATT